MLIHACVCPNDYVSLLSYLDRKLPLMPASFLDNRMRVREIALSSVQNLTPLQPSCNLYTHISERSHALFKCVVNSFLGLHCSIRFSKLRKNTSRPPRVVSTPRVRARAHVLVSRTGAPTHTSPNATPLTPVLLRACGVAVPSLMAP